jgi:hypothetical protein
MIYSITHWLFNWVIGWGGIGILVVLGLWVLWYFTPGVLGATKRDIFVAAISATVLWFIVTFLSATYYERGYKAAMDHISSQNAEAARAVKNAITNVDQCYNSGGEWDSSAGVCRR